MCGIFGFAAAPGATVQPKDLKGLATALFRLSASRGKEASGYALLTGDRIDVDRAPVPSDQLMARAGTKRVFNRIAPDRATVLIGHSRLATSGFHGLNINNQPIYTNGWIGVHNGVIANYADLIRRFDDIALASTNDSEMLFALLARFADGQRLSAKAIDRLFATIEGSASLAALPAAGDSLVLASNHGSLFFAMARNGSVLVFTSERYILESCLGRFDTGAAPTITQVHAGQSYLVRWADGLQTTCLDAVGQPVANTATATRIFDRLIIEATARQNLRRCTRCVLPETMPFIEFDDQGVCNYCHNYTPVELKPMAELEAVLAGHRRAGGGPDCIMGLSGGRDSSYALHWLCAELGMRPMAYTYDWGMVNDLARRNQARMVGKLKVEHLIIAAPIAQKLANIRANINAWMKRPDLGMVPLFMAGDKLFFVYLNQLHRQTGIPLSIWANNRYERIEFKSGFAGVRPDGTTQIRVATPLLNKLGLAAHYLKQFVLNPAYLNRSLPDTLAGFYSYFFAPQDFINLYDYIPWDEATIIDTLERLYNWERAGDTATTWRIGDGTAAFYNFIYYTVAGFTENDAFRANQIREGMISRDKALELVAVENLPRHDTIRDYCTLVGVDFNQVLKTIEAMPKLYMGDQ